MPRDNRKITFEVHPEDVGLRLDQALAARVPGLSRRKARALLDIGGVFVDRRRVKVASRTVRVGQVIEAHIGGALERASKNVGRRARKQDARALPDPTIVFEDDSIVVVDKPANLITAPTPESDRGNLVDILRRRGEDAGTSKSEIFVVHRIDLGTSGLLVFARTPEANRALAGRFREHDVEREYIAVVAGDASAAFADGKDEARDQTGDDSDALTVRLAIDGRPAVTHLRLVETIGGMASVLQARLETGRTHQIRIHCSHLGHPVLGDRRHGPRRGERLAGIPPLPRTLRPPRMALHAAVLGFVHPVTGESMRFESPVPARLTDWLERLRAAGHRHSDRDSDRDSDPPTRRSIMIERHVYVRLNEQYRGQRDEMVAHTLKVFKTIPGVVSIKVGTPADDHANAAWDLCLMVGFASMDDVEPYRVHPIHVEYVNEYINPRAEMKKAWNFVVAE